MSRLYEIPFIIAVEADGRAEADNEASDLADCIADTFPNRVRSADALITQDHNLLDRLRISYEGKDFTG